MKGKKIPGGSERTVLELLWERSPQTMTELFHMLKENPGWSKSTVNTMLARMCDNGLIKYKQGGKAKLYFPLIAKEEANIAETESFLDRVFDGSVSMMMSSLVKEKKLDADEIAELRKILDKPIKLKK